MTIPTAVRIVEVGPRDGLQNEAKPISVATRIELIERLAKAGVSHIEAGSFVSPKWVPQMSASDEVFKGLARQDGVTYSALTPNLQGLEAAIVSGVKEVAVFAAASEGFSQKNINCSIAESLSRFKPVMQRAAEENIPVRGYVSCVLGCPYEGNVAPNQVLAVSASLMEMGCFEVSLGDTIGTGTVGSMRRLLDSLVPTLTARQLALHCHDTYGQALANISAGLDYGIAIIDTSVAGLGGCPYARGASGNVATEDVLFMLNGMGIDTHIDLPSMIETGNWICTELKRSNQSRVGAAASIN